MRQSILRNQLIAAIKSDREGFQQDLSELMSASHLDGINQELLEDGVDNFVSDNTENTHVREMMLQWRLRVLDNIQFGLTLRL